MTVVLVLLVVLLLVLLLATTLVDQTRQLTCGEAERQQRFPGR